MCGRGLEIEDPALDCDSASGATDRTRAVCPREEINTSVGDGQIHRFVIQVTCYLNAKAYGIK